MQISKRHALLIFGLFVVLAGSLRPLGVCAADYKTKIEAFMNQSNILINNVNLLSEKIVGKDGMGDNERTIYVDCTSSRSVSDPKVFARGCKVAVWALDNPVSTMFGGAYLDPEELQPLINAIGTMIDAVNKTGSISITSGALVYKTKDGMTIVTSIASTSQRPTYLICPNSAKTETVTCYLTAAQLATLKAIFEKAASTLSR